MNAASHARLAACAFAAAVAVLLLLVVPVLLLLPLLRVERSCFGGIGAPVLLLLQLLLLVLLVAAEPRGQQETVVCLTDYPWARLQMLMVLLLLPALLLVETPSHVRP